MTMSTERDTSFIPDTPSGPLDEYRKRAKFNWKLLRLIFEKEKQLRLKYNVWQKIEEHPLFAKPKETLSADEQKYRAALQMNVMKELNFRSNDIDQTNHKEKVAARKFPIDNN